MDTAQLLVTLLGAGGGAAVLTALINGIFKWVSGASSREREKNSELATQRLHAIEERDRAFQERDKEAARRRKADEYASALRRQLVENGLTPGEWYDDHTFTPEEVKALKKENNDEQRRPHAQARRGGSGAHSEKPAPQ